jgi:hypothetical protein
MTKRNAATEKRLRLPWATKRLGAVIRTPAASGATPLIRTRFSGGWDFAPETSLRKGVHGRIMVERTREVKAIADEAIRVRHLASVCARKRSLLPLF